MVYVTNVLAIESKYVIGKSTYSIFLIMGGMICTERFL